MFLLFRPDAKQIAEFIEAQSQLELTYPSVGATKNGDHAPGYTVDHHCLQLGSGQFTFEAALAALQQWQHYQFSWIELYRPEGSPVASQTVGVLARASGLWVLNACRIVYVVNEQKPARRFAFAYGTLPEHAESGEERFQIEWRGDDSVWYDILAFSRPNQRLSRIAYPYVRSKQKQFAHESMRAIKAAVHQRLDRDAAGPAPGTRD